MNLDITRLYLYNTLVFMCYCVLTVFQYADSSIENVGSISLEVHFLSKSDTSYTGIVTYTANVTLWRNMDIHAHIRG